MIDLDNFFMSFFKGKYAEPPEAVRETLMRLSPEAVEIEWHLDGDVFEAIYREVGIEKISYFDKDGSWIDTKTNLAIDIIPDKIRIKLEQNWEIMNAISFVSAHDTKFEFITRDKNKVRYLIFTDEEGNITNQSNLNDESLL